MLDLTNITNSPLSEINKINLREISTEDLRAGLRLSLEYTAKHLIFLGKMWIELERRGENLSEFKKGFIQFLPFIGNGKLNPDIALRFAGRQMLLTQLTKINPRFQAKILNGEKFDLAILEKGKVKKVSISVDELLVSDHYVFFNESERKIRTYEEQKKILLDKKPTRRAPVRPINIRYYPERDYVTVRSVVIPIETLFAFLSEHSGHDINNIKSYLNLKK